MSGETGALFVFGVESRSGSVTESTTQQQCGGSDTARFHWARLYGGVSNREKYHPLLAGKKPVRSRGVFQEVSNFFRGAENVPSIKDFRRPTFRGEKSRVERQSAAFTGSGARGEANADSSGAIR